LVRRAVWNQSEVQIRKRISLRNRASFEIEYTVELCGGRELEGVFALEMNYSLLAGDAHDRYYFHDHELNAGKLASEADFGKVSCVGLKDEWLNVTLTLRTLKPAQAHVCPVRTVSNSEGGFEAVYQSSTVVLQWPLKLYPASSPLARGADSAVFAVTLLQETGRARD